MGGVHDKFLNGIRRPIRSMAILIIRIEYREGSSPNVIMLIANKDMVGSFDTNFECVICFAEHETFLEIDAR